MGALSSLYYGDIMQKQIYLAGDMLNRGAQLQRAEEKEDLQNLGYKLYVPQDNKEINDKENLSSDDGLAEKIVKADTNGIIDSDVIVMEAREAALGTCIEMGQVKGMRDLAKMILEEQGDSDELNPKTLERILDLCYKVLSKKVLVHNSDIRRGGNPTETGDRRSYGPHQYMYGVVLDVTDGKGYREWKEILNELG